MNVNIRISARQVNKMLGEKVVGISKILPDALKKNLTRSMTLAKRWAPYDTGDTKSGIMAPRITRTARGAIGILDWKELNSRRQASFKRSKTKYKDFVSWMHKSNYAKTFNWHGKSPQFFYIAERSSIKNLRRDVLEMLKRI